MSCMSDLDAMHYDKTGKNHNGAVEQEDGDNEAVGVGDEDLWKQLQ